MSGYLIAGSYDRSFSLSDYLLKRALRILPAYWAALFFSLVIGITLSKLPLASFITAPLTWRYIACNLTFTNFLQPSLPGLFLHNPSGAAVNGALWTIKIEITFYLLVPLITLWSRRFGAWKVLPPVFFASACFHAALDRLHHPVLAKQLPGQLCFFAIGMMIHQSFRLIDTYKRSAWMCALVALGAYFAVGGVALEAIAAGSAVLLFALLTPPVAGPTKYGDLSYGIYVFHYPIIQTLVSVGIFDTHPKLAIYIVFFMVTILAIVSWNMLEAPSLRLSHRKRVQYSQATSIPNPLPSGLV